MNTEPTEAHTIEACKVLKYDWASYAGNHLSTDEDHCIEALAKYIANQQPAIAPELVADMDACVRKLARSGNLEAIGIVAELDASKPVDPLYEVVGKLQKVNKLLSDEQITEYLHKELAAKGLHITEIKP